MGGRAAFQSTSTNGWRERETSAATTKDTALLELALVSVITVMFSAHALTIVLMTRPRYLDRKWLAGEGDVSGYYKGYSALGVSARVSDYGYVFGPRFNYRPNDSSTVFRSEMAGGRGRRQRLLQRIQRSWS